MHGTSFGYTIVPDDFCAVTLAPSLNNELIIFCIPLTYFFNLSYFIPYKIIMNHDSGFMNHDSGS